MCDTKKINRKLVLGKRTEFLTKNPQCFRGNTRQLAEYKKLLDKMDPALTPFQKQALIGLILSDASVEVKNTLSPSGRINSRIKTQQTEKNIKLLNHFKFELFEEFSGNNDPVGVVSDNRPKMYEFDTLTCSNFKETISNFSKTPITGKFEKEINPTIKNDLTPVVVAYWFCGDGGKVNYSGEGKGISFATEGFTKSDTSFLANCLKENGLDCRLDLTNSTKEQYSIYLSGSSYDKFIEKVGPYIPEFMAYKLPTGRVEGSRWGSMTEEMKQNIIGSHFKTNDWIYSNINWNT